MDLSRDYDTDESEAEVSQPTPKKRKQYKQKYNHSWEKDPAETVGIFWGIFWGIQTNGLGISREIFRVKIKFGSGDTDN